MNRLIETIRNIFKIEELRKRILFTVLIILVYRFGSFVVIPGVDPATKASTAAATTASASPSKSSSPKSTSRRS